ncbi:MAG: GtrA family protein [Oscillospiraceae bacterium]|nr:GtrA family protein [Oscillospiraceae bacterium]
MRKGNIMISKLSKLYKKHEDIILYIIFGGLTTVVSFAVQLGAPRLFNASVNVSTVLSWIASVTFAYVTNRIFVFKSKNSGFAGVAKEAVSFYTARLLTLGMEFLIMWLCADKFSSFFISVFGLEKIDYSSGLLSFFDGAFETNTFIFKFLANILILISNYILSKMVIFKTKTQNC